MRKKALVQSIIATLETDLAILLGAAQAAHAAASHAECIPDNKYDTLGLEASYIAQGQANRAQEIRAALECYRALVLRPFDEKSPIRLTALITLEDEDGNCRTVFLGPDAGGLKIATNGEEIIVITPLSPLGRGLIGKHCGEELQIGDGTQARECMIVAVQ